MIQQYSTEQQLNTDLETAWQFFSSADNLPKITDPKMNFKVLSHFEDDSIFEGMLIDYKVTPLLGIEMSWQTEIIQVDFQKSFTDFQKKGPYKLWKHFHEFFPNENGVLMKDTVDYEIPFGFLGEIANGLLIRNKIKEIFDYRRKILKDLF